MQDIYDNSYTTHTIVVKGGLNERLGLTFAPDFSIKEITKESQCYGKIFPNDRIVAVEHDVIEGIRDKDQLAQTILKYLKSGDDFKILVKRLKRGQTGNQTTPAVQNQETSIYSGQQVSMNQNTNVNIMNANNVYFVQGNDGIHQLQQERQQMNAQGMEVQRAMQQYQHQMLMQQHHQRYQYQQHQYQHHHYQQQGHLQHQILHQGNVVQQPLRNGMQESSLQNYHQMPEGSIEQKQKVSTGETSTISKLITNEKHTPTGNKEDFSTAPDSSREEIQSKINPSDSTRIENKAMIKSSKITPKHSQCTVAKDVKDSSTTEHRTQQGIMNVSSVPPSQSSQNSKQLKGVTQASVSISKQMNARSAESKTLQKSSQIEKKTEVSPTQTSPVEEGAITTIANSESENMVKTEEFKKITLNVEKGSLGVRVDFADIIVITKVRPESQLVNIAKAGDVILSFIINGHEYNKWRSKDMFLAFMLEKTDEKKTIVLGRRTKEKGAMSRNSKASPQEISTHQDTDKTLETTIDGKESSSSISKASPQETNTLGTTIDDKESSSGITKASPQERNTCQDTDKTLETNVDGEESSSSISKASPQEISTCQNTDTTLGTNVDGKESSSSISKALPPQETNTCKDTDTTLGTTIDGKESIDSISSFSKAPPQERNTCQDTDKTLETNVDGEESSSSISKASPQETNTCKDTDTTLGTTIDGKESIDSISSFSKAPPQETNTRQDTDKTLGTNVDGEESSSSISKASPQEISTCQDTDKGTSKQSELDNDIVANVNHQKKAAANSSTHLNKDYSEKTKTHHKDTGLEDHLPNSEAQNLDNLEPNYDKSLYCDICEKNDGYHNMVIQKCCQCGVCVHEECYMMATEGVPRGKKFEDWKCHACKSVGQSVNAKFGNAVKRVKIQSRPMKCALCNISKSLHAMHPLYNTHGKEGLPLGASTKFADEGIVWVHTTCASALGLHAQCGGIVFGCYEDGRYEGDEEDEDEEDEVEISLELDLHHYQNGKRNVSPIIHHFVIDRIDERSKGILKDLQSQLICTVCKKQSFNSNKIPIQCHAKDCHSAFHVGCARWGSTQAVYNFFPGLNHVDEVSACFCPKHKSLARLKHDKSEDTYEFQTKSEAERKGAHALCVGEDGYIFDVDASSDEADSEMEDVLDEELEMSGKRNKKRKKLMDDKSKQVKRRKEKNKTDPPQKGDGSAPTKYFEKKGEIAENSQKMIDDLASLLKSSSSNPRKALKRICSHYKEKLSPGIYKKCKEKTEERMIQMVTDACARQQTHTRQAIPKKGKVPERKKASGPENPWKDLFYPHFQFGNVLPSGWTR